MIPTSPGIYRGITEDEYNSIIAVRRTFLWDLHSRSPMYAMWSQNNRKDTEPFRDGRMTHTFVLEPREFLERYERLPSFELDTDNLTKEGKAPKSPRATSYYKAKVKEFVERAALKGKEIVDYESYDMAYGIGHNILESSDGRRHFDRGPASEAVAVWKDDATGLLCKARYDCLVEGDMPTAADIKTCRDLRRFQYDFKDFGYYFQASFYLQGLVANDKHDPNFLFIVGEKTPPYEVPDPVQVDKPSLQLGDIHVAKALKLYKQCVESGQWPARGGSGIQSIGLSDWDLKELEEKQDA